MQTTALRGSSRSEQHARTTAAEPSGAGLLGHLRHFREDPLEFLLRAARECGDVARFRLGRQVFFLVNRPAYAKHFLADEHKSYSKDTRGYAAMETFVGRGILTSEGDFWLRQRKIVQPAFHREHIAGFASAMVRAAEENLDGWQARARADVPIDVAEEMMLLTMRIVCTTLLGSDAVEDSEAVGRATAALQRFTNRRLTEAIPFPVPWAARVDGEHWEALRVLDEVVFAMIDAPPKQGNDVLSLLRAARDDEDQPMPRTQIRDELVTLLLAGHETTAQALTFTLMLLSRSPAVARQLCSEIDEVLGDRAPSAEDLPRLPYAVAVLKESMRLFPPAWLIARRAERDDVIGGCSIPSGSIVVTSPYVMHRRDDLWPNPEGFDPDRWLGAAAPEPFSYFPFGGGPRKCIGDGFAMAEGVLALAAICRRYELHLLPRLIELDPLITLRPKGGVWMRAKPRLRAGRAEASAVSTGLLIELRCGRTRAETSEGDHALDLTPSRRTRIYENPCSPWTRVLVRVNAGAVSMGRCSQGSLHTARHTRGAGSPSS